MQESRELLSDLEPALVDLEQNPREPEKLEEPFRILHSIKGMSSFFGLSPIKRIAHRMEDLLDHARSSNQPLSESQINALFRGADILGKLYGEVFEGKTELELSSDQESFLDDLRDLTESQAPDKMWLERIVDEGGEYLSTLLEEPSLSDHPALNGLNELLMEAEASLQEQDSDGAGDAQSNKMYFPADLKIEGLSVETQLHEMESICRDVSEQELEGLDAPDCQTIESALDQCMDEVSQQEWEEMLKTLQEMRDEFDTFMESTGFNYILAGSFLEHLETLRDRLDDHCGKATGPMRKSSSSRKDGVSQGTSVSKTFRVEEQKVDRFMDYVGELIITVEQYNHIESRLNDRVDDAELKSQFQQVNQSFRDLSHELQESLMDVRRLPARNLLKKVPVMVRKLTRDLDKQVDVEVKGEELSVDKVFLDELEAPLTHLVRNAVDHGIESPDVREKNDKPSTGHIDVSLVSNEDQLSLTVRDDGAGIDTDTLRQKLVEKRGMDRDRVGDLPEKELLQYLFQSGMSTAREVTEVSGRGVGMSAVKQAIDRLDGEIILNTEPGQGTEVHIRCPLNQTLNVLEGLVIRSGRHHFVVPMEALKDSIPLKDVRVQSVESRGEIVSVRDQIYPLVRLPTVLGLQPPESREYPVVLLLENDRSTYAIVADRVEEQQKLVVRELGPVARQSRYFSGGAVLGDGRLHLVLDVDQLQVEST